MLETKSLHKQVGKDWDVFVKKQNNIFKKKLIYRKKKPQNNQTTIHNKDMHKPSSELYLCIYLQTNHSPKHTFNRTSFYFIKIYKPYRNLFVVGRSSQLSRQTWELRLWLIFRILIEFDFI